MNYYLVECALNKTINCLGKNYISLPIQDAGGGKYAGGGSNVGNRTLRGMLHNPHPPPLLTPCRVFKLDTHF